MPDTDFSGQGVLVTGGASGIGLAAAEAFAARGARVAIADLNLDSAATEAARLGTGHIGLGGDVSTEAAADALVSATVDAFGRIDVLVNCAGMADTFVETVDQSAAQWQRLIDVHLTGTFVMSKRAARDMIAAGHGVIINIASISGILSLPRRNAYTAAKHGIVGLTKNLACEWAQAGLRVNAIAPGYILTPMVQNLIDTGKLDPMVIRRRTPVGELLPPSCVADAMIFLASPLARMVTGVTLPVDGGYTVYGGPADAAEIED